MKSTFIAPDGSRIVIEPSPTRGGVWIELHPARPGNPDQFSKVIAIPLHLAGNVAQAIEATATLIEEACLRPELPAGALQPHSCLALSADGEGASAAPSPEAFESLDVRLMP
jgi:hypothetical protein